MQFALRVTHHQFADGRRADVGGVDNQPVKVESTVADNRLSKYCVAGYIKVFDLSVRDVGSASKLSILTR